MAKNSRIEWTTHTFNPWWGCVKVSPACKHCYAESWAKRVGSNVWGIKAERRFFGDKHWSEPVKWNAAAAASGMRARVFCASMADVFEDRRDLDVHRIRLWKLIEATPRLDWLLLTKRPEIVIRDYIRLFTFVTKHGTYIDGFAAPQQRDKKEFCSANLVLQARPPWMREFWLCDRDPKGVQLLEEIKVTETIPKPKRRVEVLEGDFNVRIHDILRAGTIKPKTATFALLDQRTFECDWATVEAIARHKQTMKIEIFYFLATGWLDRSIAAVRKPETAERLTRWWGRDDWMGLRGRHSTLRGIDLAERFKNELGYTYAYAYPIHSQWRGGRIMYHMVHATDHPAASPLMQRAYRKVSGRDLSTAMTDEEAQQDIEALLRKIEAGDPLDLVSNFDDIEDRISTVTS